MADMIVSCVFCHGDVHVWRFTRAGAHQNAGPLSTKCPTCGRWLGLGPDRRVFGIGIPQQRRPLLARLLHR